MAVQMYNQGLNTKLVARVVRKGDQPSSPPPDQAATLLDEAAVANQKANNLDDTGDYRPGRQAAREFGVRSPLDEVDLTKDEIRELSRRAGLPAWDEPASACLSSRIPYHTEVTDEKLRTIERAEQAPVHRRHAQIAAAAVRGLPPRRRGPGRGAGPGADLGRRHVGAQLCLRGPGPHGTGTDVC